MTEEKLIKTVNRLLYTATTAIIAGTSLIITRPREEPPQEFITEEEEVQEVNGKEGKAKRQPNPVILAESELRSIWEGLEVNYITVETEYLGRYFVTAYSDEETYSRATASGVEVHYSEDPFEPTTCAIDRNFHRFGDLLMVDGKVYVAEDTGSGVKGLWIDCFVETMEEVREWDTGYKSAYAVNYEKHELKRHERKVLHERLNNYLHFGSAGGGCPHRHDLRTDY